MKEYEVVREIFNACSGNKNADVSISEMEIEDIETYLQKRYGNQDITLEKEILTDGSIAYKITSLGLLHRYSFTEI